ncbi:MAG: DUF1573 domain-containing protein [Bacteroidales bacterium]|nr:DUF1573 domain-containing protein [Bacteroidales bacterium]
MKLIAHISAAILALTACAAHAQKVTWLETKHDFGAFDETLGPVSTDFRFINTSPDPVAIVAARASCGCTTPEYTRDPIAPGDTATLTVTYDPAGRPGRFSKYVAVDLSDGSPRTKLFIHGTVVGSPTSVALRFPAQCGTTIQLARGAVMSGEVTKGKMRTTFLEAYNRSTEPIQPTVSNLPKYYTVTVTPETVPPGEQFSFIVYMNSATCPLYGLVTDSMTIRANPADTAACTIPLTAMVREDFSNLTPQQLQKAPVATLSDPTVDFGHLTAGATSTTTLTNTGKTPLIIRRIYTADPGVTVSCPDTTLRPGKSTTITVRVDPAQLPGAILNARISLITNDPTNPVITIRAVGTL